MAEASFAKQFLAQLDSRPSKRADDFAFDISQIPKGPIPQLPDPGVPFPVTTRTTAERGSIAVTLKPMKGEAITVPDLDPATTSVYDLKVAAGKQNGYAPDKIKVLLARKPVADSKLLDEVLAGQADTGASKVELGVMYVGAPTEKRGSDSGAAEEPQSEVPVAQGQSGEAVLATGKFWEDLEGYLLQRVRDEEAAKRAVGLFQKAWVSR